MNSTTSAGTKHRRLAMAGLMCAMLAGCGTPVGGSVTSATDPTSDYDAETDVFDGAVEAANVAPGCLARATSGHAEQPIAGQAGTFEMSWDVTPGTRNAGTAAVALAQGAPRGAWTDLAVIIRFNNRGTIDARNGSGYSALAAVTYTAGTPYHLRASVNVAAHTYSVFVRSAQGPEILLARDFSFRTEQRTATQLDYWGVMSDGLALQACRSEACAAESDAQFCARLGKDCGTVADTDNCEAPRSATCGECSGAQTCGGGTPNVCGIPAVGGGNYASTSALYQAEPLGIGPWQPNTPYAFGQRVANGGCIYQAINPDVGRSAGAGGPTCTAGTCAADGTVVWRYSAASQGPIYYACDCATGSGARGMVVDPRCVAGSDANAGTEPSAPLQTYAAAMRQLAALPAGGTVALCRGGVFVQSSESDYVNRSCTAANPCTLRDYVAPWDTDGTAVVRNPENEAYRMPAITSALYTRTLAYWRGGTAGLRVLNVYLKSTRDRDTATVWAFGMGPNETDFTVNNTVVDGFLVMAQGDEKGTLRFSMVGNKVRYCPDQGPNLGGDDVLIADNYFEYIGRAVYYHSIYMATHGSTAHRLRVTGNEIYHNAEDAAGNCTAAPIVFHGEFEDAVIENNLIYQAPGKSGAGCWGIALDAGGYCAQFRTPTWFRNTRIRRNRIFNVGNTGIEISQCADCVVEDNLIVQTPGPEWRGAFGIHAGWYRSSATACGPLGSDDQNTRNTIRNNTIYHLGTDASSYGIRVATEGSGHNVTGNAVQMPAGTCFQLGVGATLGYTGNNACSGGASFAAPFDGAGVTANPAFANPTTEPATADFTPAAGSPLIGRASTASACTVGGVANQPCAASDDLTGKRRDAAPDIGAYER